MSKMAKTVYVPRFGSQLRCSQTDEPKEYRMDLPSTCSQKKQPVNRWSSKKGKCPRFRNYATNKKVNNENKPVASPVLQHSRPTPKTRWAVDCEEEETHLTSHYGTVFDPEGDLSPPQPNRRHTTDTNNEKFKPAVLRTISKMLRENRCIRQRLLSLCQSSCRLTGHAHDRLPR